MRESNRVFPFVWPWKIDSSNNFDILKVLYSRKFTLLYLAFCWLLVLLFGFASTWDCESTWQYNFYCEYASWIKNLENRPLAFLRNIVTTPFIHNGLDHLLFVSLLGFLLIVQSHERYFGTKKTLMVFYSSYAIVGSLFAVVYTFAYKVFPDSDFLNFVFARNWVGGSIGMFQVLGSLAHASRKPWMILLIPILFEGFNLIVFDIHPQISLMHISSTFCGYILSFGIWRTGTRS